MAERLNKHIAELIEKLRERIKKLDHDQNRAMELAAYVTMSKQATQDYDERAQRLTELRRELLNLMQGQK